ncbi:hypothetical protein CLV24_114173 [Pontibacter ummariensis]|uniref:Type IX secretion system protein PorV domain-containing protein n=1 Tax=Pontibacter ummariensis TaxID=1610492 RepID=A0A239HUG9_9BACT|nr:type IX secretion system outer membrane channel protein PorV [Pontibacter ummariensis]PRY10444.1 hypothetical protein CLV24_114173 [Pontibacter ummariensis]SNS84949.1 hypothetical protein SAMN06296052_114173 [Pontibacter ummariensis]
MYNKSQILKATALAFAMFSAPAAFAQSTVGGDVRAVTTAVPILTVAPDSRSAALGDAGVALAPDANAPYWNAAKLGFVENDLSVAFSYAKWLGNLVDDMSLNYLSGYKKLNETSAIAVSMMYFDLGEIQFIDANQAPLQNYNPKEYAVAVSYGQALSENFGVGIAARFIHSNLAGDVNISSSTNMEAQPGNTAAVDVGVYYTKDLSQQLNLALGANIANIGGKIAYAENEDKSFLPTNLKVGTAVKYNLDAYNTLTLVLDANKLLVPSPGADTDQSVISGIFTSFTDAEDGASGELKEVNVSAGLEYWYNELFAARVGYFHESPQTGGRRYFSTGLGLRYQKFGLDAAYLIPSDQTNPLADTWRFTLALNLD